MQIGSSNIFEISKYHCSIGSLGTCPSLRGSFYCGLRRPTREDGEAADLADLATNNTLPLECAHHHLDCSVKREAFHKTDPPECMCKAVALTVELKTGQVVKDSSNLNQKGL
eukprot:6082244-Amphidinium_carterae.2